MCGEAAGQTPGISTPPYTWEPSNLQDETGPERDVCWYSVILSVLDPRKCEYLKDYSLDFEHAYMTMYLAS